MTFEPVRILIADDHPLVLQGVATIFAGRRDIQVVARAATGGEAISLYRQHRPDAALLDLRMPDMTGVEAFQKIRDFDPAARVVILSAFDEDGDVVRALHGGVRGYLRKDAAPEDIIVAVLRVVAGQRYIPYAIAEKLARYVEESGLTLRETEVLVLAARGSKNKQIAVQLGISTGTVKGYFNNILLKLGAKDRTEAVTIGLRRGIISIDGI